MIFEEQGTTSRPDTLTKIVPASMLPFVVNLLTLSMPRRVRVASLAVFGGLVLFALSAVAAPSAKLVQLPNGVHLILSPDRRYPRAAVLVRYKAGVLHQGGAKPGVAHLLEHVTFRPPRPSALGVVNVGAFASHGSNASTHAEFTQYFHVEPSYRFQLALWLERWRLSVMPRHWSASDMKAEQPIVRNEERWRRETRAHMGGEIKLWQALFPQPHPLHHLMHAPDVESITFADLQSFFARWYVPANTWVAVTGDFDPVEAEALLRDYFGSLEAVEGPPQPKIAPPTITQAQHIHHSDSLAHQPRLMMAWHSPSLLQPGDAEAAIASELLTELRSARLKMDVPDAASLSSFQMSMANGSVFHLTAEPRAGVSLEQLEAQIDQALQRMAQSPPADRELDRATRTILQRTFAAAEDPIAKANLLVDVMSTLGDCDPEDVQRKRLLGVTGPQVQAFVANVLSPSRKVVVYSQPMSAVAARKTK